MWCRHRSSSNISPHISSNFDLHQPYFRRSKLRLSWAGRKKHSTPQYLWKHKSSPASWRSKLLSHNKLWKFPGSKPEWKLQSSAKKSRFFFKISVSVWKNNFFTSFAKTELMSSTASVKKSCRIPIFLIKCRSFAVSRRATTIFPSFNGKCRLAVKIYKNNIRCFMKVFSSPDVLHQWNKSRFYAVTAENKLQRRHEIKFSDCDVRNSLDHHQPEIYIEPSS